MGHSSTTHAIAYSSQQVGSEEAHFNAYHFAIGDTSYLISQSITRLSLANLRNAVRLRYPTSTIIHVSPYRFLAGYQFAMAPTAFEKLSFKSNICVFSGRDITSDGPLPEELREKENLPSLLFLSLDAVSNLFMCFSEVLKSWVDVVNKIVIDDVHTILSE
ncbi:hypothetical protein MHU86_25529 [Fragilaria crotonensis]|nr:hypothetical protein MHU86_25529 [Fragilaria crotonensis]